ncbi:ROK family transcriptional regulator [Cellulomonas xiejunii]|uniref:ROK family transcriptional regulator n=1 Tax=Cellulomonas xiejunii TaxID=2968083 RepID=A0ABY5KQR6_9CELL|nr:ROK family transcriptional regulator [Cellulomonas xiejunii]MCC2321490.1 ROK family transcriptional regulator [Cellulomonas xiejunii]MCC2323358.1 ROK family transcriptional regulator [Cellulomonas xiejunii]UUI72063.1 ROK family transcriptional regulator [Cellulomonas xiejunii]
MRAVRSLGPSAARTRSAILDMVRSSGTVSRIELAEMSGLTAASITRFVKSLLDDRLLVETGYGDPTGGKRRSLLELNPRARYAVGLSLDVARLSYVVVDLGGEVVGQLVSPGIGQSTPSVTVPRIADELEMLFRQVDLPVEDIVGVGVAGAGLDLGTGVDGWSATTDEWDSFAVQEALQKRVGLPVVRDNDAACAALGQYWTGRIPATQDFATLYMSLGFGMGLMVGGGVSRGASSNVGELGHMVVDIDGPECWCGSRGCLEMLAAPRAVVRRALGSPGLAAELGLSGDEAHVRQDFDAVARAAAEGRERPRELVEDSARYVAAAVLSVVNLLDLDLLYLAGPGFVDAGAIYVRHIRERVARVARIRAIHSVTVELSTPGADAAASGAATLALQHVLMPHARVRREPARS